MVQKSPVEERKEEEPKSLPDAGKQGIASGMNAYVPNTVFTVGQAGSVQMSPFQSLSLDGELQKTHNEIIKMQNSMIEHKKKKLIENSSDTFKPSTLYTDDDGDFVDFGLVGLREQGFEHQMLEQGAEERTKSR